MASPNEAATFFDYIDPTYPQMTQYPPPPTTQQTWETPSQESPHLPPTQDIWEDSVQQTPVDHARPRREIHPPDLWTYDQNQTRAAQRAARRTHVPQYKRGRI